MNLEVAKVNACRATKLASVIADDQNLRYEINTG